MFKEKIFFAEERERDGDLLLVFINLKNHLFEKMYRSSNPGKRKVRKEVDKTYIDEKG